MSEPTRPTHADLVATIDGLPSETPVDDPLHDDPPLEVIDPLPEMPFPDSVLDGVHTIQAGSQPPSEALVPAAPTAVVMPAVTVEGALRLWDQYLELKAAIAQPSDIQDVYQRGELKQFYKKSYWRKIATYINLSVKVIKDTQVINQLVQGQ